MVLIHMPIHVPLNRPCFFQTSRCHPLINGHDSGTDENWRYLVPTTYFWGLCPRESPQKIWPVVVQYLQFQAPRVPIVILGRARQLVMSGLPQEDTTKMHYLDLRMRLEDKESPGEIMRNPRCEWTLWIQGRNEKWLI